MNNLLLALEEQWRGVLVLVLFVLVLMFVVGKLFWLMGWGRFATIDRGDQGDVIPNAQVGSASNTGDPSTIWSFFATQFIAKTISEFRHLLALLIFLLFSFAVILAVLPGLLLLNVEQMSEG